MNRNFHSNVVLLALIGMLFTSGCGHMEVNPRRDEVQSAEKMCTTYDCYMKRLFNNTKEVSTNDKGYQIIRWYMSVRKIRPLGYGEEPRDDRYYRYYNQDCWFTATFDQNGNVLETEWEGPGCWGDGL